MLTQSKMQRGARAGGFGRIGGVVLVGLITLAPVASVAATLEEELASLLSDNPRLLAANKAVAAARQGVNEVFGSYLPELIVRGNGGWEVTDSPTRRALDQGSLETGTYATQAQLRQRVFDGFEREGRFSISQSELSRSGSDFDATLQDVLFAGAATYHDILRESQRLALARQQEANILNQLGLEDERVERGGGIEVDVLFAKARLQNAKQERVLIEGLLRAADARYQQVFGYSPPYEKMEEPIPPFQILPEDLEAAVLTAELNNPRLRSAVTEVRIADEERTIAASDYYPDIDLVGRGSLEENIDGIEGYRREAGALVEFSWTLFDGFSREARTARAAERYGESLDLQRETRRRVREEVELAYNELLTARERVDLLTNAVAIAGEVFDARTRLRELGLETAVNVLDAESELFRAQIELTDADFDARIAVFRLAAAIGELTPERLKLQYPAAFRPNTSSPK